MQSRTFRIYLVACAALVAAHLFADGVSRDVWGLALEVTALAACTGSVTRHHRSHRLPWTVLAAALALFVGGDTIYAVHRHAAIPETAALVADIGYFIGYVMLGAVCTMLSRTTDRTVNVDSLIDAAIVAVSLAAVLLDLLVQQPLGEVASPLGRVVTVSAPLMLAVSLSLCARVVFVRGARRPSPWLLLLAGVSTVAGNILLALTGNPTAGHNSRWVDLLWLIGFVATGAAAAHPSAVGLTSGHRDPDGTVPFARLAVLGAALLAGPIMIVAGGLVHETGVSEPAVASIVVTGLVVWRLVRVVSEREEARGELQTRAERQEALLGIGERALGDRQLSDLHRDAAQLVVALTRATACEVVPTRTVAPTGCGDGPLLHVPIGTARGGTPEDDLGVIVAVMTACTEDEHRFLKGLAAVLAGATLRRRTEAAIRHQAWHDPLTGLPNRLLLGERLAGALGVGDPERVGLLFLDLDGFKAVNDAYGHLTGDRLLRQVAARLGQQLRGTDTLARFAGDEFVVLVEGLDVLALARLQQRLTDAVALPFDLGGVRVTVTGSVGSACGRAGDVPEDLLRRADAAMYAHKSATRPGDLPGDRAAPPSRPAAAVGVARL